MFTLPLYPPEKSIEEGLLNVGCKKSATFSNKFHRFRASGTVFFYYPPVPPTAGPLEAFYIARIIICTWEWNKNFNELHQ